MKCTPLLTFIASIALAQSSTPQEEVIQLVNEGRFAEARPIVSRLVAEAAHPGVSISYRAVLYKLLGTVEQGLGRYADAERAVREGLALCEQRPGPDSRICVSVLVLLGDLQIALGHLQEAGTAYRRAQALAQSVSPVDQIGLALALNGLGSLYWTQGLLSQAESVIRKALTILEKQLGPDHPDVYVQLSNLGVLLEMTGRRAEGVSMLERAERGVPAAFGPGHPRTIGVRYSLAIAITKSDPTRAEALLRSILSAWTSRRPERHPDLAHFLNALAWTRYEQKDIQEAVILNERALGISRDVFGEEHSQVMELLYDRSVLLKAAKRGKEAAKSKAQAARIQEKTGLADFRRHSIDVRALSIR